ncbi:50S ribosomal protein L25 [bacterium]|nr:MAG: 50S ribosomal protein L25 [bacterium]
MQEISVSAEARGDKNTKHQLSELRRAKKIPAVVYGGKDKPVSVAVGAKELMEALKKAGANAIIHLKLAKGTDTVILKELQRDVVNGQPVHADFKRIDLKEKIVVQVPLHAVGEAPGVKLGGGLLEHVLRQIEIRCLPTAIPKAIDFDVSAMQVNDALHVRDLKLPEGVELLTKADQVVVHVVIVKVEVEAVAAPVEGAPVEGAEPEVIAAKGKKDEEGNVVPADKKAGAAPAAGDKKAAPAAKEGAKKEGK